MLRTLLLPPTLALLVLTVPCAAQESRVSLRRDQSPGISSIEAAASAGISPTPEMWFYEQERGRYDDPKMAIRRRAEVRAAERRARIASLEWYGMSLSRPVCNGTPYCGGYSAYWSSNSFDPLRWRPVAMPPVIERTTGARE